MDEHLCLILGFMVPTIICCFPRPLANFMFPMTYVEMDEYLCLKVHRGGEFLDNEQTMCEGGKCENLKLIWIGKVSLSWQLY